MSRQHRAGEGRIFSRWTFGAGRGAIALLTLLILAGLIAVAARPPEWAQFVLGALLAIGSALWAGLAAQALRPEDRFAEGSYMGAEPSGDERQQERRTA